MGDFHVFKIVQRDFADISSKHECLAHQAAEIKI